MSFYVLLVCFVVAAVMASVFGLLLWFGKSKETRSSTAKERIEIVTQINPHATTMRLDEWRKTPALVSEAIKLMQNPSMQLMIAVLRNESQASYVLPKFNVSESDRLAHLGQIEGYQIAMNNLESLAMPYIDPAPPLDAAFELDKPTDKKE